MSRPFHTAAEEGSLDLRELRFLLRRGVKWIAGGAMLGLLAGALVLSIVAPRYQGRASVLLRNSQPASTSAGFSDLLETLGNLPITIGGSGVDTETSLLLSRVVVGEVVDSLGLQLEVVEPRALAPRDLFERIEVQPDTRRSEYTFEAQAGGYRVEGPGAGQGTVSPGGSLTLPGAELRLSRGPLPERFTVRFRNREAAITAVETRLTTEMPGGEVVRVRFRSTSPDLAAAVPNAVISTYLTRRRTTDRGVNQHRYEFLRDHTESMAVQLAMAEEALRRHQESSGVFDPSLTAGAGYRRVSELQAELEGVEVEARSLQGLLSQASTGNLAPRELAAYPTFISNPAINGVLARLLDLETQRVAILERRPATDPEVVPLTQSIEHLESRLVAISTDYLAGLLRRRAEIRTELARHQGEMARLPSQAEVGLRLEREVQRLAETQTALQTQLVAAQLAAISEGGDVRQVDVAVPPERPTFPNRVLTLLGGLLGGLFFGTVAAVGAGQVRRRICNPVEAEIATGIPTLFFGEHVPLSFPEIEGSRSILLIPAEAGAAVLPVGERLATTAALQGRRAVFADLTRNGTPVSSPLTDHIEVGKLVPVEGPPVPEDVAGRAFTLYQAHTNGHPDGRTTLTRLEAESSLVVAALPPVMDASTISVLGPGRSVVIVAGEGVMRDKLQATIDSCVRMGATVVGLVLHPQLRRR